jgi:ribonuclease HII
VFVRIVETAISVAVGVADINLIACANILWASQFAMKEAVLALNPLPDFVLVDGNVSLPCNFLQAAIVGGDRRVNSIAAASVVAKVMRDKLMLQYHELYPAYRFDRHKGYGTKEHFAALKKFGPSPVHRMGWECVMRFNVRGEKGSTLGKGRGTLNVAR